MMREIMLSIISSYISRVKRKKDETQMSKASSMMFKEKKNYSIYSTRLLLD